MDEKLLEKLRAEHGRIGHVDVAGQTIVCRKPKAGEFQQFTDKVLSEKASKSTTAKAFVLSCVVHPERESARLLFEEYPALIALFSAALQDLAGGDLEIVVSKS